MSTTRFHHFLLTRYAVRDRSGTLHVPLNPEWFSKRLELFNRHTLPSVKAQTTKDFTWLLFFSLEYLPEMNPVFEAIKDLTSARLHVVVDGDWSDCNAEMRAAMSSYLADETHIISTRIDSDDEVGSDFMELIQAGFTGQPERTFLNFQHGIMIENGKPHPWINRANMFQSVIEPVCDAMGIFTWHHGYTWKEGPVIQLQQPGRWMHVIHGGNAGGK